MATFDAPNREVCTVRRTRTNTPLQALVTLNDPVYVEAAQALARRMMAGGGANPEDCARLGFRLCLARPPHGSRSWPGWSSCTSTAAADLPATPRRPRNWRPSRWAPAPAGANVTQLAAWTVVANVLLNLDEMMMKR